MARQCTAIATEINVGPGAVEAARDVKTVMMKARIVPGEGQEGRLMSQIDLMISVQMQNPSSLTLTHLSRTLFEHLRDLLAEAYPKV